MRCLTHLTKLRQLQSLTGKSVNAIIAERLGETANKGIFTFLDVIASGNDPQIPITWFQTHHV
jgi:hypothetical protein